jgi:protein O-mannosyl-transferase
MANPIDRWPQGPAPVEKRHGVFVIATVLVCLFAYGLVLDGPLFFDDIPNLTDNVLLHIDGQDYHDWQVAVMSNDAGVFHRPVAMLTFAANYVAAGDFSPVALKATNVAIHLLTGLGIYFLCLALLQAPALPASGRGNTRIVALTAAALWLLHPLHVTTVLYAIQRMAQLSALFTVMGLLVFCRYRLRWAQTGASTGELIAAALWLLLITVLAVLSKENGALLPWLVVVVEVTLFRGVWRGQHCASLQRLGWVILVLPVLLIALVLLVSPETIAGRFASREFSLEERLLTEGRVLWHYLGWILVPDITAMGFFHDDIALSRDLWSPYTTALSLLAWVAAIAIAVLLRHKFPLLLFALLFYLVAHSMESTILPLELVFEHRNYLPSVAVCLLVAAALFQFSARIKGLRLRVTLGIVLGVLSALLFIQTNAWTDEMTLARFNVVNHPASPRANFFYGNALFERFSRAQELGLDDEEQKSLAISSRTYFARMHALDPRSLAALVMLYQLDTLYFPGLAQENDWLARMEELATEKRLHASDRTALGALAKFAQTAAGKADRARVSSMLDQLIARYPNRIDLVAQQYKLLASQDAPDGEQLRELLQDAAQRSPDNRMLYAYLVQYHGKEDTARTYEWIRTWMQLDTRRRELPVIRRIFEH